jgi:hypothetical protein
MSIRLVVSSTCAGDLVIGTHACVLVHQIYVHGVAGEGMPVS